MYAELRLSSLCADSLLWLCVYGLGCVCLAPLLTSQPPVPLHPNHHSALLPSVPLLLCPSHSRAWHWHHWLDSSSTCLECWASTSRCVHDTVQQIDVVRARPCSCCLSPTPTNHYQNMLLTCPTYLYPPTHNPYNTHQLFQHKTPTPTNKHRVCPLVPATCGCCCSTEASRQCCCCTCSSGSGSTWRRQSPQHSHSDCSLQVGVRLSLFVACW